MNAEATFADDVEQLFEADPTAIILFSGAARNEAAIVNCENERVEELLVAAVKRDVDENALATIGQGLRDPARLLRRGGFLLRGRPTTRVRRIATDAEVPEIPLKRRGGCLLGSADRILRGRRTCLLHPKNRLARGAAAKRDRGGRA